MAPRAVANQLAAETPFDNFSFEPIREHQVLPTSWVVAIQVAVLLQQGK
jgi:hypothetical protein